MDNYSRKAKFEDIKDDWEAVKFHALKFELGYVYPLSVACYHHYQSNKDSHADSN